MLWLCVMNNKKQISVLVSQALETDCHFRESSHCLSKYPVHPPPSKMNSNPAIEFRMCALYLEIYLYAISVV
jgi:hypothetical protein